MLEIIAEVSNVYNPKNGEVFYLLEMSHVYQYHGIENDLQIFRSEVCAEARSPVLQVYN